MAELTFQAAGKPWSGLRTALWKKLAEAAGEAARAPGFPRSPEALGWALKRVIPAPVPGIWTSGPLAGGPTKWVSVPRSRGSVVDDIGAAIRAEPDV